MTDIKLPPMPHPQLEKAGWTFYDDSDMENYAREAVRLNAQAVPEGDAAEAIHDTNAVLASRYFELLKVVEAYEKRGVTCQTFRHFVDTPCAECNCAPAAPAAPAAPQPARTALEQYNLDQSEDYRKGYNDGRVRGYGVGYHQATEHAAMRAQQPTDMKDALLRQALKALEPFELSTSLAERTAEAIRNHLGVKND